MRGRIWPRRTRRPSRRGRRMLVVLGVCVIALAGAGAVLADAFGGAPNDNPWPYNNPGPAPVLAAVGDISCQPGSPVESEKQSDVCDTSGTGADHTRMSAQTATANQVEAIQPSLVAILGDEQYQVGRYQDFLGSFDHTYGAFKFLQRPSPGNHEFYTSHGETGDQGLGYFDYYNGYQLDATGNPLTQSFTDSKGATFTQPVPRPQGQAGQFGSSGDGWYSYNLGNWHIISLNAECANMNGGCSPTGQWVQSETQWLGQDLRQDHSMCTMAYWHQPAFSTANTTDPNGVPYANGAEGAMSDGWWKLLYAHHADLVLNGHEHLYARFAPMDPGGNADPRNGIREFIIGTGGEGLDSYNAATPNLEKVTNNYYGVMKFTLRPGGYAWDYESALESTTAPAGTAPSYSDTGSASCHGNGEQDN